MGESDVNERPEVGGEGGARRVVAQAETETFVWLPIHNIPRRSPKQATGMKYLLAKCNNWQREQKPARSLTLSLLLPWKTSGRTGRSFSDVELFKLLRYFFFLHYFGLWPLVLQNKHSWNSAARKVNIAVD